ncbi:response regulator [Mesorhizobium sp. AR02]|uniref:response regulator n=1 Tax=Mesorhizobium sp. AR02 TaxID=2865837 RepID=UPI00215E6E52|nr:response regulator [Mesorhizobium sp. AR02]UVK54802.1 response regulator [Mesorhizobium sp. AR02]
MIEASSRRVLIVEDEILVAMLIEDMLIELGFAVVGPAMRLQHALKMAQEESLDLAVLDVNLANEQSFPVARALQQRGIPFIFATAYGSKGLNDRFQEVITLQKPFELHQLKHAISSVLASK